MIEDPDLSHLAHVAAEIKAWDAVALVGAGVSEPARLPLTESLEALLWHALDADPEALAALQALVGVVGLSAKPTVERLGPDREAVWEIVASHATARREFQRGFTALDATRRKRFSPSHDALAQMLHRRQVEFVVSLNWDTQLEAAWYERYGQSLAIGDRLIKPHGDAACPDEPWVLPGEQRLLPDEVVRRINDLAAERPRVLLVAGYAESDALILQQIVTPLEEQWKVVRIGPDATGALALPASVAVALPQLRNAISSTRETGIWEYARFDPQHNLGWALAGRGLGTHDVEACPVVPEVSSAVNELRATGAVTIIGESGVGKSLAAAHAAHAFWRQGWEVVELAEPDADPTELRGALLDLPRPVIAIVDDAQRLLPATRRELLTSAGAELCVILMLNADARDEPGIFLDATRATTQLARFIRSNEVSILPAVHSLDPTVGDRPFDESLKHRLAQAEAVATTPWHLLFVLTGGWRRIRGQVVELRTLGEYDLVLGAVAVLQLLKRAGSATKAELLQLAQEGARTEPWLEAALSEAVERRLLIHEHSTFRLPHMRFAGVVLQLVLDAPTRASLLEVVGSLVKSSRYDLLGIHWLLDDLVFANPGRRESSLISLPVAEQLVERCWHADQSEHGAAALVLNDVRSLWPATVDLPHNAMTLGAWISQAQPASASGLARLVNDTFNMDRNLVGSICEHVDVADLARIFESSKWPDPYFYGELIDRLALGPPSFRERMKEALNPEALVALCRQWAHTYDRELSDLAKVLSAISAYEHDLALTICEELSVAIAERWQEQFATGYNDLLDILFLLGFGPRFLRRRQPNRRQHRIARTICQSLDPEVVASHVSHATHREWQGVGEGLSLICEASPTQHLRIMRLIDFSLIDATTTEFWPQDVETLRPLLVGFAGKEHQYVTPWIERHMPQMMRVDVLAAALAPAASAKRLSELGATIDLCNPSHSWTVTAMAIRAVGDEDPEVVRRSIAAHRTAFAEAFGNAFQLDKAEVVVELMEDRYSVELRAVVGEIDASKARESWPRVLRSRQAGSRRTISRLVACAVESVGPMNDLALELRERFPSTVGDIPSNLKQP